MASLPVGQFIPIAPGRNNMTTRKNEPMSHFLSLEIQKNELLEIFSRKLNALQQDLAQWPGIGKPTKTTSVHVTVAALSVSKEELEEVTGKIDKAIKQYRKITNPTTGLLVEFKGLDFGDDALWASMTLGVDSLKMLRELIEIEAEPYIVDNRFTPHLSIYRKCGASEEVKESVRTSVGGVELGCLHVEAITLKEKKMGNGIPEPCRKWSFMNM